MRLVVLEEAVRGFPRYHKYTLDSDLRAQVRQVCRLILRACEAREHCVGWMSEAKSTISELRKVGRVDERSEIHHQRVAKGGFRFAHPPYSYSYSFEPR